MKRGDVVLVRFPHPSGLRGKKRPAVVVQSDTYASAIHTLVIAEVTKNLTMANDPACLFIDTNTPEGKATGLVRDSVMSCLVLVTVYKDTVAQVLGSLSPAMVQKLNDCLKVALGCRNNRVVGSPSSQILDEASKLRSAARIKHKCDNQCPGKGCAGARCR